MKDALELDDAIDDTMNEGLLHVFEDEKISLKEYLNKWKMFNENKTTRDDYQSFDTRFFSFGSFDICTSDKESMLQQRL